MTTEKLGWIVFAGLAVFAVVLWAQLPRTALIVCAVVMVILVSRLLFAKRM